MKRSVLAHELVPRSMKISERLDMKERELVLNEFSLKLWRSGCTNVERDDIIEAGLKNYERKKKLAA